MPYIVPTFIQPNTEQSPIDEQKAEPDQTKEYKVFVKMQQYAREASLKAREAEHAAVAQHARDEYSSWEKLYLCNIGTRLGN